MSPRFDDKTIGDDEVLWRRISNNPVWVKKEAEDGKVKPSSAAFLDNYTNEVSVSVASLTTQEAVMENYPDMGLVSILAGFPRSLGHIIAATPEIIDDLAHRVICPPSDASKTKRKTLAKIMSEKAKWVLYPRDFRD